MNRKNLILLLGVFSAFAVFKSLAAEEPALPPSASKLVIHADQPGATISRNIYGQFSEHLGRCIYEGIWVGEDSSIPNTRGIRNDVVAALRRIKVPVIRWPGGCFADEYHWRDGIGPREKRPAMINTHWGGVVENNHFGTHEFMDLCEQVGADPYVCGNVGSGTVQEMMEWVEYMTSDANSPLANLRRANGREKAWRVPYFGVGNESWGCGGNMRPEFYSDNFRRYNTFVKDYAGSHIQRFACGANGADYTWTEVMMDRVKRGIDGLSLHYYTIPSGDWARKGSATRFAEPQWQATIRQALRMEDIINRHTAIMDRQDARKRVGLIVDEWGVWHDVEPGTNPGFLYQQNTLRDALVAGSTLNIFNNHCDRVKMANIAQMINVLQAMILTEKERMLLTPTYHVFEMYIPHQEARLLPTDLQSAAYEFEGERLGAVNVSASRDANNRIHLTFCNVHPEASSEAQCELRGAKVQKMSGRVLTAPDMTAHNTFTAPETLKPAPFTAFKITDAGFVATLPPMSVVSLEIE